MYLNPCSTDKLARYVINDSPVIILAKENGEVYSVDSYINSQIKQSFEILLKAFNQYG